MARKTGRHADLRRRAPFRLPRPMVLVVCEGEKTEQTYFRELGRELGAVVVLHVEGRGKDPLTLVRRAAARRDEWYRRSKRRNDPFLAYEAAWCVCDVDDHATLPEARRAASRAEVCLAVSNPCFELWFLLHFADQSGHIGRDHLVRKLSEHVSTYDKHIPFDVLKPHHADAVRTARGLRAEHKRNGEDGKNPSTDVDLLTESLHTRGGLQQRSRWMLSRDGGTSRD